MQGEEQKEITIVEQKTQQGGSGVVGLYLKGGKVIFRNNFSAQDDDDATSYDVKMTFSADEYRRKVQELREKGKCVIKGENDWEILTIGVTTDPTMKETFGKMSFHCDTSISTAGTFFVDWSIDNISLPETSVKQAERKSLTPAQQDIV